MAAKELDQTKVTQQYKSRKNPNEKELMFERWLSYSENLDDIQTKRCIEALYVAGDWARKLSITTRNRFEIKDAGELARVTDALWANSQFSEYDTSMKQVFTKAIDMLVDYYYDQE